MPRLLTAITARIDEAIPYSARALELDPFNALFHGLYSMVLNGARRYDEAIAEARTILAMQPGGLDWEIESPLVLNGMRDEHLAFQRNRYAGDPELVGAFEQGLAESGYEGVQRHIADIMAARYEKSGRGIPYDIAGQYLYAGDHERSIVWLERAFEVRDPMLPYIGLDPIFDLVRSDPRFQDLLRRMNLPTTSTSFDPDEQKGGLTLGEHYRGAVQSSPASLRHRSVLPARVRKDVPQAA